MEQRTEHEVRMRSIRQFSSGHRKAILESDFVGCFSCEEIYRPNAIEDWIEGPAEIDRTGTAVCPRCGVDAVLPGSKIDISSEMLSDMNRFWCS